MELDRRSHMALFRFGVIAPLVQAQVTAEEKNLLRREILAREYEWPNGRTKPVDETTVRRWVRRYRQQGFEGLMDGKRADAGKCRAIAGDVLLAAENLRRELPTRSVKTIISLLESAGYETKALADTTLGRHLNGRGASKARLAHGNGDYQSFVKDLPNALWQADVAHGIWLPDPYNPKKVKRTKLILFIDDASRLCPHVQFYWDEQLPSLVDCFRKALMKRGKPVQLLFDNGFIFHSTTIEYMCAALGIRISFAKPFSPSTKGKVERFIGALKSRFYPEAQNAGFTKLEELNAFLFAWLSKEYHKKEHGGLDGKTPLERWRQDEEQIERVKPEDIKRALMLRATRRVHIRTASISLEGRTYQASPELAGQTVELRWHAGDTGEVEVHSGGKMVGTAKLSTISKDVDFSKLPKRNLDKEPGVPLRSSAAYAQSLMGRHTGEKELANMPALSHDYLNQQDLEKLVAEGLCRELSAEELTALASFFLANAPLRRQSVTERLESAVSAKGRERHLRFYLEQISTRRDWR